MPDLDPREPTTTTTTTTTDKKNSSASKPSPSSPSSRARKESRHNVVGVDSNDLKQPTPKASSTTTTGAEEGGGKKSTAGEERGKAENPGPKQPSSSSSSPQIPARTTSKTTTIGKSTIAAAAAAAHSDEDEEDGGTEESAASKDLTDQSHEDQASASAAEDDTGPLVDMETFGQLLEMDDDEEHSFSKSLTWDYFDQAVTTFKEMDAAVLGGDLITLSRKGHFLKGSSAALGLNRVKASCEKMQHYGNRKRANGEGALSESEAMHRCKNLLNQLKEEQKLSKAWLERFYAERNV